MGAALPPQLRGWAAPLVPGGDTGCARGYPVRRWHSGDWDLEVRGHPQDHPAPLLALPAPYTAPLPALPASHPSPAAPDQPRLPPWHCPTLPRPCRRRVKAWSPRLGVQDQPPAPLAGAAGPRSCKVLSWRGSSNRVSIGWLPAGPSRASVSPGPQLCQRPPGERHKGAISDAN